MNPAAKNTEKMMLWHKLRRKLLMKQPLSDTEYTMLSKVMSAAEGTVYPSLRQVQNYQRFGVQIMCCQIEDQRSLDCYAGCMADTEEKFIKPYDHLYREQQQADDNHG